MVVPSGKSVTRVFAVVVLYKLLPRESPTLQTLLGAAQSALSGQLDLEILVWDNTPGGQDPGELPPGIRYVSAPHNPGLAIAYNYALHAAHEGGREWLLTLDQDSVLPLGFMARIAQLAWELRNNSEIAAIVPQIEGDKRNLSPFCFYRGAFPRWFTYGFIGVPTEATFALNSAATYRVAVLRQMGGYDPMFPLDVSDINLFYRIYRSGFKVFVAGDLLVTHEFSLLNKKKRMSLDRYRSQLRDECAFWDMHMGRAARFERLIRLGGRVFKDLPSSENRPFCKVAILEIRRRLLSRRSRRILAWEVWALNRATSSALPGVVTNENQSKSHQSAASRGSLIDLSLDEAGTIYPEFQDDGKGLR